MRLTMSERSAVIRRTYQRYQRAGRSEKSKILDEFVLLSGYSRAYAALVLRSWGRTVEGKRSHGPLRFVAGCPPRPGRGAPRIYGPEVLTVLERLWMLCDCMCGKLLASAIRTLLPVYQKWGEIKVDDEVREKLLTISPATIDRLLSPTRRRMFAPTANSHTRPGPDALRNRIPVRTFEEWDRSIIGQMQADLVGHDGGISYGEFAFTCTLTDIATGWTELRVLRNKARKWVAIALDQMRESLPFPMLSLGTDCGSEFINDHLYSWCTAHQIAMSHTRPYRKNDNCYVEQKNGAVVRRAAAHLRYDTEAERALLGAIYQRQSVLTNYFYPTMVLESKTRRGSKTHRNYSQPKTPAQRLLDSGSLGETQQQRLRSVFTQTNPAELKRQVVDLQQQLFSMASSKPPPRVKIPGRRIEIHAH